MSPGKSISAGRRSSSGSSGWCEGSRWPMSPRPRRRPLGCPRGPSFSMSPRSIASRRPTSSHARIGRRIRRRSMSCCAPRMNRCGGWPVGFGFRRRASPKSRRRWNPPSRLPSWHGCSRSARSGADPYILGWDIRFPEVLVLESLITKKRTCLRGMGQQED